MDAKFNGNTMTMAHFHDFYYLEALQAQMAMAKSANSELGFRHSFERLENDVKEAFEHVANSMALRVYVYLWAASLGEARHAADMVPQYIEELDGYNRSAVYGMALDYFPSDTNVNLLKGIYAQNWGGSYGGRAWLSIVEGMELYGKVSHGAFIDHAVDLEHNGGNVFTKDATRFTGMNCFGNYNASDLRYFLNYKFQHDILDTKRTDYSFKDYSFEVSRKVYNLIVRFSNIVRKISATEYLVPSLEWLSDYSVEWGTNELTIAEQDENDINKSRCQNCGERRMDTEDHEHFNGMCVCNSCYRELHDNYDNCGNCQELVSNDDMVYIQDEDAHWCETCANHHATFCDGCNTYNHDTILTEEGHSYCQECQDEHATMCCECDTWHEDIESHNAQTHKPETETEYFAPLAQDADGYFQMVTPSDEPVFHKASFKFHTGAGLFDMVAKVWDVPGSGFIVTNWNIDYMGKLTTRDGKWTITNVTSGRTMGIHDSKESALRVVMAIKDIIDWNTITCQQDYNELSPETREKILDAVKGAK